MRDETTNGKRPLLWRLLQRNASQLATMDWSSEQITSSPQVVKVKQTLVGHATVLGAIVAAMWFLEIVDLAFFRGGLDWFGIQPRSAIGLRNVLFSPFLHVGFGHMLANTIPFIVLGWLVMVRGMRDFVIVSLIAGLLSGLGVWLLAGSDTVTLGMSGVIFGYLGYLLARGYYERSALAIILAVIAVLLYGSMIFGVLPTRQGVSWLGHLFGLIGGVVAAYVLVRSPGKLNVMRNP